MIPFPLLAGTHPPRIVHFHVVPVLIAVVCLGAAATAGEPRSTNGVTKLPTVTVTAAKAPDNLQNLPLSATAVTKETLDNAANQRHQR